MEDLQQQTPEGESAESSVGLRILNKPNRWPSGRSHKVRPGCCPTQRQFFSINKVISITPNISDLQRLKLPTLIFDLFVTPEKNVKCLVKRKLNTFLSKLKSRCKRVGLLCFNLYVFRQGHLQLSKENDQSKLFLKSYSKHFFKEKWNKMSSKACLASDTSD